MSIAVNELTQIDAHAANMEKTHCFRQNYAPVLSMLDESSSNAAISAR
jgi:hypothetical protein